MLRHQLLDRALARGLPPDVVLRLGSRWWTVARVHRAARGGVEAQEARLRALVAHMSSGPIGAQGSAADEAPAELFGLLLGPRRKYSSCLWADGVRDLAAAEEAMLELTCARAGIVDGMDVLDLGCGWGPLSLWVAEKYPGCAVLGVTSSDDQRAWIEAEAGRRGLANLEIRTQDVDGFEPGRGFDRVVSLELFGQARNWAELLRRVSTWLKQDGKLFVHVPTQRRLPHGLDVTWAAERSFTAPVIPSHDMLCFFQRDMVLEQRWAVPGTHHAMTLRAWLGNLDRDRAEALRILGRFHPPSVARRLLASRRLSLISSDVIWGRRGGGEWLVSHYLLSAR